MTRAELTIRGGGIFGLSIAWEAARRGARIRLIETAHIGAGASGGLVGALAPHVPENWNPKKQFQLESLLAAEAFFTSATKETGLATGYARTGRLQPIPDAAALTLAHQRGQNAQSLWHGAAHWQVIEARPADWCPTSPTGYLIHDTLTARIHPRLTAKALTEAIRSKGGEIILGDAPNEGPTIWATGTQGLQDLTHSLNKPAGDGVKGQAALLAYDARQLPQLFADTIHIVPHEDGTTAIGSTSEHAAQTPETDAQLETLIARARAALPALANAQVLDRWAGFRPRAKSRAPLLGPWPNRPGHFIANGGFKIGFGMAPKVAQCMIDLVLENRDTIPPDFHTNQL